MIYFCYFLTENIDDVTDEAGNIALRSEIAAYRMKITW